MARLSILSNDEINALYAIPTLTNQERHSFFELENDDCRTPLGYASDIIINATEKLPIFKEYNLSDYGVHASIDGQK